MRRLSCLLVLSIVVPGCARSTDPAGPAPEKKGTIGVSVMTTTNPFFKVIGDTITAEAGKHGYDVIVVSGDNDVSQQQRQVRDFIRRKVLAIVLCPCDSQAIGAVIQEANQAGIPVFTADLACMAKGPKIVQHVATDNLGGGKLAAQGMIEALGKSGGKVVILDYKQAESCILRVNGFKQVIEEHNSKGDGGKITIVSELPCGGDKDMGFRAAQDALQAHPDLVGIFAINDPSALGAYTALEKAGKTEQVKIIGFDGMPEGKQAIKEGKIYADPIQFPDQIASKTVAAMVAYFNGDKLEKEVLIPTSLYRKADAEKDPSLK
ncbi:MAG: substrate-binding domain-containing protein [Gemmataceae bacterium]